MKVFSIPDSLVQSINSQRFIFQISPSWDIEWFVPERVNWSFAVDAVAIAEIGGLILVQPDPIELNPIVGPQVVKLRVPELFDVRVEE
mmetsp:Transcript_21981/g.16341  ORF Transcript_21981/g.16341 Transcript_21981/m.16341 type:complete len:88 (-) Transcript_21981:3236-3499(-)